MIRFAIALLVILLVQGCAEGGIGGTGAVLPPLPGSQFKQDSNVSMDGQGNKGPFADGARVTVRTLSGIFETEGASSGALGAFAVFVPDGEARRIDVTGTYFSESAGTVSASNISLSAIVVGVTGRHANVNAATHLVHRRIIRLIDSGVDAVSAIEMAEAELLLALSPILPAPANPLDFSLLVVINAAQDPRNEEGNAWLLALSAVIEQSAIDLAAANGTAVNAELATLLTQLSAAFEPDGTFGPADLDPLMTAHARINPNVVHDHLLHLESSLLTSALVSAGVTETQAANLFCVVIGSDIKCVDSSDNVALSAGPTFGQHADGSDSTSLVSLALGSVVADLNRFLDSDADGIVNIDDDDDDNDGTPDSEDDTPFGN